MTEPRHRELALHPVDAEPRALLRRRQILRRARITGVVVVLLLALGAGRTVLSRIANARDLDARVAEAGRTYVKTATAKRAAAGQTVSLPGTLQGYTQAPIAARANGYLKRWTHDIGTRVRAGELLAEIEAPELDQQLRQAVAAREQAASALALAQSTAQRWDGLRRQDVVSQQDLDEKRNAVSQGRANLAAADANVQRLRELQGYKRVNTPFAGVVIRRSVDVGDLVDPTRPLFVLSQTDPLRVYVNVPQTWAAQVRAGMAATVTQAELPGQRFTGRVVHTAGAIDTATRTMAVEVQLRNPDGALLPGAYVQVELPLGNAGVLIAPTAALIFRAEGTLVAVVDTAGKVSLRRVQVGRNFGETFEALGGIAATDQLVLNPPDSIADGQTVVAAAAAPSASATAQRKP